MHWVLWDQFRRRWRENKAQVLTTLAVLFLLSLIFSPPISPTPSHHRFADLRNLLGVPNTLNVVTSLPFLVIGVVGFVFCLYGNCLGISLKGEVWSWAVFFGGFVGMAFGSAYYHLSPDAARAVWERLPMMTSTTALFSALVTERVDRRLGVTSLISLLILVLVSITYERIYSDLKLSIMLQSISCLAVFTIIWLFRPKYSHSRYWFLAVGCYLLARFDAVYDKKVYIFSRYIISGHSLEHLFLAMVPVILIVMLWRRCIKVDRDS